MSLVLLFFDLNENEFVYPSVGAVTFTAYVPDVTLYLGWQSISNPSDTWTVKTDSTTSWTASSDSSSTWTTNSDTSSTWTLVTDNSTDWTVH